MANCFLDLTDFWGNQQEFVQTAYSVTLNNRDTVKTFLEEIDVVGGITKLKYLLIPKADLLPSMKVVPFSFYPNTKDSSVVTIDSFLQSVLEWSGQSYLNDWDFRPIQSVEFGTVYTRQDPNTTGYDANGRINLGSVNGDPCKRGYYGFVAEEVGNTYSNFEVCYISKLNKTFVQTAKQTEALGIGTARKVGERNEVRIKGERGPIIISNDISRRSNAGVSIVDDPIACPPPDPGVFFATDIDFGELESGTIDTQNVLLYNRTSPTPPNSGELVLLDITPKEHPNFRILDFNYGTPFSQLTKSPLDLPLNPLTMPADANMPFSYGVEYDPKGELGVVHQMEITYLVETKTTKSQLVTQEKITTTLRGIGYNVSVTCSDANWGQVDVFNLDNKKDVVIQNVGTKDVYLYDYKLKQSGNYFLVSTNLSISKQKPLKLAPNESYTIVLNYNPNGVIGIEHTAQLQFSFAYDHPKLGAMMGEVRGKKTISYLRGIGYSDPIDDVIDDVTGVVTGDDNGVFVTKVLSNILDKSVTVQKNRTFPLWTCVGDRLYELYTGSTSEKMDKYYLPVYNKPEGQHGSYHQFDISYGHVNGSGSSYYDDNNLVQLYPSKAMYRKYLVECYGHISGSYNIPQKFIFRNGVESDSVYFIQLDRDDYRDMLDPGNFEISLVPLSSSANQLYNTGSNYFVDPSSSVVYKLIDNSLDTKQDRTDRSGLETFYYIVSGSIELGIYGEPTDNVWGMVFPKMGLIVLDGNVLDASCSFNTVTASIDGDNINKLFLSLSGSLSSSPARPVSQSMFARSAEKALIQTYFCRANPDEFNYSTNPTYVSGSLNSIKYSYFIKEPKTYITSIGLYNRKNELLAIGKFRRPILKTDKTQYVFQVRVRIM